MPELVMGVLSELLVDGLEMLLTYLQSLYRDPERCKIRKQAKAKKRERQGNFQMALSTRFSFDFN